MADENTEEVELEQEIDDVDQLETEEETESEQTDQTEGGNEEDTTDWKTEALKYKAILDRKTKKPTPQAPKEQTQSINNNAQIDPEELKLIAKGFSDEEIAKARVIAKGNETGLLEAIKDPLFEVFQKDLKEKERRENAKLGASKGSSQAQEKAFKPGMKPEEHKALWKQKMGV